MFFFHCVYTPSMSVSYELFLYISVHNSSQSFHFPLFPSRTFICSRTCIITNRWRWGALSFFVFGLWFSIWFNIQLFSFPNNELLMFKFIKFLNSSIYKNFLEFNENNLNTIIIIIIIFIYLALPISQYNRWPNNWNILIVHSSWRTDIGFRGTEMIDSILKLH